MFTIVITASLALVGAACISQAKWIHYSTGSQPLRDFVKYDEASRGPISSLQALWSLNGNYIVGLGAILTILSIGIGPTVQQMIVIRSKQVDSAAVAKLPRAQSYLQAGHSMTTTNEMMGSVYSGMHVGSDNSSGIFLDVIPDCPSGNCTFPPFQSLAVCSSCSDLTSRLAHKCHNATLDRLHNYSNSTRNTEFYCQMSLANGLSVNVSALNGENSLRIGGYLPLVEPHAQQYGNVFLSYTKILGPVLPVSADFTSVISHTTAQQCVMYWCVNTYQSHGQNGRVHEETTASWHDSTTRWWAAQGSDGPQNAYYLALKPHASSHNFTVGYIASNRVSTWLAALMTLSSSTQYTLANGTYSIAPDDSMNASSSTLDRVNAFRRDTDNGLLFANMAKSMTRHIRSVDLSEQAASGWTINHLPNVTGVGRAIGTVQVEHVYVSVRYGWLTLSILLVGLGMVLLACTVFNARRHDTEVWKSSPLPILLQALGTEMMRESGSAMTKVEMEELAKGVNVMLWVDSGRLGLDKEIKPKR